MISRPMRRIISFPPRPNYLAHVKPVDLNALRRAVQPSVRSALFPKSYMYNKDPTHPLTDLVYLLWYTIHIRDRADLTLTKKGL